MCAGRTRCELDGAVESAAGFAYERASSISAAVPEALSFAPAPAPLLSRCAITTIADGERPARPREVLERQAPASRNLGRETIGARR